jgi:hypothetical protein
VVSQVRKVRGTWGTQRMNAQSCTLTRYNRQKRNSQIHLL